MNRTTVFGVASRMLAVAAAISVFACDREPSAPEAALRVSTARQPATTDMAVASLSPDSATQDTTLDVVINGSGFVSGTTATWALAGVSYPVQIKTNGTRYVNQKQLIANITIAAGATVGKWDVVVAAAGKKGGIGTEAFAVRPRGNVDTHSRANYIIADQVIVNGVPVPAGLKGDGRMRDGAPATGGVSEYQGDFCGTVASIANQRNETGMLTMDPGQDTRPACGSQRYYVFNLNGQLVNSAPLHRIFDIWSIEPGQSINSGQGFGVTLTNCQILMFNSEYGGDDLKVTRTDSGAGPRKWVVETQGAHLAACIVPSKKGGIPTPTGVKYYLPFHMVVTEVPYPYPTYP